jgi:hypothetical protein
MQILKILNKVSGVNNTMMKQKTVNRALSACCCLYLLSVLVLDCQAQPIVDTVHAIQKQNERSFRMLDNLDNTGDSYTFTNVIKWKITDPDLQNQVRDAIAKEPFNLKREEFDVVETYIFAAPAGQDKVEPFHILVRGYIKEKTTKKKKVVIGGFGDEEDNSSQQMIPKAFQGRNVIRLMHRNPTLLENVNSIQGDNVEMPGDIVPHGSQLVKDTKMRYIISKVFDQFYSKQIVLDEQRRFYGLPTRSDQFDLPAEVSAIDSVKSPIDPESTTALPDDQSSISRSKLDYLAAKSEKTVDISITDLRVNASKKLGFELELGNKEVGLPFWSSGEGRFWLNLKNQIGGESNFKIGLAFPLDLGNSDALTFKARQLSGTFGGSVDAYFAGIDFFSGFNLPLAFKFSIMPSGQGSNSSILSNGTATTATALDGSTVIIPAGKTFYREALILQLYIPTIVQLDLNNFVQVSVGFGLDNVYQSIIPGSGHGSFTDNSAGKHPLFDPSQADKIQDLTRVSNAVSPHVEIDYVNHQASKFGLSIAYDHLFTFGGWIELVEDHFRIELSYSGPIIRDPKPYEPASFFLITPRFYF